MIKFVNGKQYPFEAKFAPPKKTPCVPFISTNIMLKGFPKEIIGKLDTGAPKTMLNSHTAEILEIDFTKEDEARAKPGHTATKGEFKYWEHYVTFIVFNEQYDHFCFPILAGFSPTIVNNLFGCDWLENFCLGIDKNSIHLLKD